MDLIANIISYYNMGDDTNVVAWRNDMGDNQLIADFSLDAEVPMPYAVIQESGTNEAHMTLGVKDQVSEATIIITVFALTRSAVVQLLDEIEDALQVATIAGTLGPPDMVNKFPFFEQNRWVGVLSYRYWIEKTFGDT